MARSEVVSGLGLAVLVEPCVPVVEPHSTRAVVQSTNKNQLNCCCSRESQESN